MDRHNFFEKTKALWELVDEKPNKVFIDMLIIGVK